MASSSLLTDSAMPASLDSMMASQYAQVLFHDVSESYTNDVDLLCNLVFTVGVEKERGDYVGLYRVPNVAIEEFVIKMDVMVDDVDVDKGKKNAMQLVFKAEALPKDDDFFQWQYVRSSESMLGASLPFQIRTPNADELVAVEDDEFMVVKSNVAVVADQYKERITDAETKYSKLLLASEQLTTDLAEKNQSCLLLSQKLESLSQLSTENATLKHDLGQVLDDKGRLVEKLHQTINKIEVLQAAMKRSQKEQDELRGELVSEAQQRSLHRQEAELMRRKNDELNVTIETITKARDKAVMEFKDTTAKLLESQKRVEDLEQEVDLLRAESEKANKSIYELEIINAEIDRENAKYKEEGLKNAEEENEDIINQLQLAIKKLTDDLSRSKEENEVLRKAIVHQEEQTKLSTNGVNLSGQEGDHCKSHVLSRIQELEMGFKSSLMTQSQELSALKEDVDRLWSLTRSSCSSSESSGGKELDSLYIQRRLNISRHSAVESKHGDDEAVMRSSFTSPAPNRSPVVDQPCGGDTRGESMKKASMQVYQEKVKSTPQESNNQAKSRSSSGIKLPIEESYVAFTKFLDQLPSSLLSARTPFSKQQEGKVVADHVDLCLDNKNGEDESTKKNDAELSELALWATANSETDVPEAFTLKCDESETEQIEDANSDEKLTPAAQESASFKSEASGYVLSDHGKPTTVELECPICQETFAREDERVFEVHVNGHLELEQRCPMCDKAFDKNDQSEYERHVQAHFSDGDDHENDDLFTHINVERSRDSRNTTEDNNSNAERPTTTSIFSNWTLEFD